MNELQIWEFVSNNYQQRNQAPLSALGPVDQWRRVSAFVSGDRITCYYVDESGATATTFYTKTLPADDEFEGLSGLRLYQESAHFRSFVMYR